MINRTNHPVCTCACIYMYMYMYMYMYNVDDACVVFGGLARTIFSLHCVYVHVHMYMCMCTLYVVCMCKWSLFLLMC